MIEKIGIICAMESELAPFLSAMEQSDTCQSAGRKFHSGTLFGVETVAVCSGGAKVNAAMATQILLSEFLCDYIIMSGVAGGLCSSLAIGDVVVADRVCYHDVDPDNLTFQYPIVPSKYYSADERFTKVNSKAKVGTFACGECFVTGDKRAEIMKNTGAIAVDMESAAVGHVCHANGNSFAVVKTIVDSAAHEPTKNFDAIIAEGSKKAFDAVKQVLDSFDEYTVYRV